jgi:hypothetical protein
MSANIFRITEFKGHNYQNQRVQIPNNKPFEEPQALNWNYCKNSVNYFRKSDIHSAFEGPGVA